MVHLSLVVQGSLVVVGGLVLVEVSVQVSVVHHLVVHVTVEVVLPERVAVVVSVHDIILLALGLLSSWLGSLWSLGLVNWLFVGGLMRSGDVLGLGSVLDWSGVSHLVGSLSGVVSGGGVHGGSVSVIMDLVMVSVFGSVARLVARVVVGLFLMMDWVVESVSVRVVGIVVVLDPLVGVHELMLVMVEGVVVLVLLEAAVLPVVREVTVVVTEVVVVVVAVVALEVVRSCVGMEVGNVVVLVDDVGVSVAVVMRPSLSVVTVSVVAPVSMGVVVTVAIPMSVAVIAVVVSVIETMGHPPETETLEVPLENRQTGDDEQPASTEGNVVVPDVLEARPAARLHQHLARGGHPDLLKAHYVEIEPLETLADGPHALLDEGSDGFGNCPDVQRGHTQLHSRCSLQESCRWIGAWTDSRSPPD